MFFHVTSLISFITSFITFRSPVHFIHMYSMYFYVKLPYQRLNLCLDSSVIMKIHMNNSENVALSEKLDNLHAL